MLTVIQATALQLCSADVLRKAVADTQNESKNANRLHWWVTHMYDIGC